MSVYRMTFPTTATASAVILLLTAASAALFVPGCAVQEPRENYQLDAMKRRWAEEDRRQQEMWDHIRATQREALEFQEQTRQQYAEQAARHIYCRDGKDCRTKWGRAVAWVSKNSRWKIQTQTDTLIQTFGPGYSDADGGYMAYTVNKVPLGDGRSEIIMSTADCGVPPCDNETNLAKVVFADFVTGKTK